MDSLTQYVSRVISFTSQYSDSNWRATNLVGPPTLNGAYGDSINSWCPSTADQNQILELQFEELVYATQIKIYENLNGGGITSIEAKNIETNEYELLWSTDMPNILQHYNIFLPEFNPTRFQTNQIRITLTQEGRGAFSEIEAVALIGTLINLSICESTISLDLCELLNSKSFSDISIELISYSETFAAHRCILTARSIELFNFIIKNDFKLEHIKPLEFKILLKYIYSDMLDEVLLKEFLEKEKLNDSNLEVIEIINNSANDEETSYFNTISDKWLLCINNLIRYSILFKMDRLQKLLVKYLMNKFLTNDNVLNILVDSVGSSSLNVLIKHDDDLYKLKLNEKFQVELAMEACLSFIRIHVKQIIKTSKFAKLPKEFIIKIVQSI
jgi:hypothetical protein